MKKGICLLVMFFAVAAAIAQTSETDSLWRVYSKQTEDTDKVRTLWNLSNAYQDHKPDTALLLSWQALLMSRKKKFLEGESWSLNQMASSYNKMGNYPRALEYYIRQLKIEEQRNNPEYLANIEMNIATVYQVQREHSKALGYALRADSLIDANKIEGLKVYSLLNLGDIYEKLNKLDSALDITFRAYSLAEVKNLSFLFGPCLNNLGNIYSKLNNIPFAFNNYREALPQLQQSGNEDFMCETYLGLAKLYLVKNQYDSAEYFGRLSYQLADKDAFQNRIIDACIFLSKVFFQKQNNVDSAYQYQARMISLKDSIYSNDRIREALNISTEEQLRQKEIANEKMIEKEERFKKLQLLSIGLFLPILFLVTIYLRKRKVKPRIVENAGIISLLLLFEYIYVLIHPFVVEKTNHIPVFELLIFAVIAAILTPAHHFVQRWMIKWLSHRKMRE